MLIPRINENAKKKIPDTLKAFTSAIQSEQVMFPCILTLGHQLRPCRSHQLDQLVSIRRNHNTHKTFIILMGRGSLSIGLIVGSV